MLNQIYITISGDTWDIIAYKTLGSEMYTDKLIKNNLEYRDIAIFPAGVEIVIPDIEPQEEISDKLPPWKRGVL